MLKYFLIGGAAGFLFSTGSVIRKRMNEESYGNLETGETRLAVIDARRKIFKENFRTENTNIFIFFFFIYKEYFANLSLNFIQFLTEEDFIKTSRDFINNINKRI
jgi:hypothetical protein